MFPMKAKPHFFWEGKLLTKNELIIVKIPTKNAADKTITVRMMRMKREATQLHLIMSSILREKRKNCPRINTLPKIKLLFSR